MTNDITVDSQIKPLCPIASMWSYHHCIIISNLDFMILKLVERFFSSCLV